MSIPNVVDPIPSQANRGELGIMELLGRTVEMRGRQDFSTTLDEGWMLLHLYSLKYEEDGVWRNQPMAFLSRPHDVAPANQ